MCLEFGIVIASGISVALLFANYIVCHFGATYMDGMTGDPPFIVYICKGDTAVEAYARFDEILTVGYF